MNHRAEARAAAAASCAGARARGACAAGLPHGRGRRAGSYWGDVRRLRGSTRRPHPLLLPFVFDPPVGIGVQGELEEEAVVVGVLLGLDAVLLEDALVRL